MTAQLVGPGGRVEVDNDLGNPLPVTGPVTDVQLRATAVPVSAASLPLPSGAAAETTLSALNTRTPQLVGTWGYAAGTSGTPTIGAGKRVISITAFASSAGSMTINGGDSIPLPANLAVSIAPLGNLVNPTLVFTSTSSFFVEWVA